jgi:hypothetical protein
MTNEYATLILIDMLRGVFSTTGWGFPLWTSVVSGVTHNWTGTWMLLYFSEWFCWFIFPLVSMLWWRSWARKHPELVEEL